MKAARAAVRRESDASTKAGLQLVPRQERVVGRRERIWSGCFARGCDQEQESGKAPPEEVAFKPTSEDSTRPRQVKGDGMVLQEEGVVGAKALNGDPALWLLLPPESVCTAGRGPARGLSVFAGVCHIPQDGILRQFVSVAKPRPLMYVPLGHMGTT